MFPSLTNHLCLNCLSLFFFNWMLIKDSRELETEIQLTPQHGQVTAGAARRCMGFK